MWKVLTPKAAPNNGMHPTRDTAALIYLNRAGGRVMPGVSWLSYCGLVDFVP